jgi:hypothetical protein
MALIMVVLTGTVSCKSCQEEAAPRERERLSLIPADALVVASMEMFPLRQSSAYKRLFRDRSPAAYYLGDDCEYNPMPDVDHVWLGADRRLEQGKGAMVVIGPVQKDRLLECFRSVARRQGLSVEEQEIEGVTVYSNGPGRIHLAWLDRQTLVVADRENMTKVLAVEKSGAPSVRTNDTLLKLHDRARQGRHVGAGLLPDEASMKRLGKVLPQKYRALTKTEQVAVGANVEKGLDLYAMLRLDSGVEAEKAHQALQQDLDRFKNNDYLVIAGLGSMLEGLRLENAGPEITATLRLSSRQFDSLTRLAMDSVEEFKRSGRPPEELLKQRLQQAVDGGLRPDGQPAEAGASPADEAPVADGSAASPSPVKAAQ